MSESELREMLTERDVALDRTLLENAALKAKIEAVLALHRPYGIYDACSHEHTTEEVECGKALDIAEIGWTCEEGLVQTVCFHCGLWNGEPYERTEDADWPCATVRALRGEP